MARILYAEDDELVGEIVRDTLTEAGHVVGVVNDGTSAFRAIQVKQPDLVILDCSMPEMGGVEVVRRIRITQGIYDTPILMLTARRSENDVDLAMRAGANDYLKKPFDPDQLVVVVDALLDRSAQKRRRAG